MVAPGVKEQPLREASPQPGITAWLHLAACLVLVLWQPVPAGALLLGGALRLRVQGGFKLELHRERVASWLDLSTAAALALAMSFGSLSRASQLHPRWFLIGVPALVAGISWLAAGRESRIHQAGVTSAVARALLAVGLLLTPVAQLFSTISAADWVLTVTAAWGVVHLLGLARFLLMRVDSAGVVESSRLILAGKGSALRNAAAALTATGVDFALFSALVAWIACAPPLATLIGAACGGVVNFSVNRSWTFDASGSKATMVRRYVVVSGASAGLNAVLVAALLWIPNENVTIVWLVARGLVFLGWNYPLHRDYVFAHGGVPATSA